MCQTSLYINLSNDILSSISLEFLGSHWSSPVCFMPTSGKFLHELIKSWVQVLLVLHSNFFLERLRVT
jgi:hypothetical protein